MRIENHRDSDGAQRVQLIVARYHQPFPPV
jgi:hypothetical protein